jgi:hypothetical protein
MWWTLCLLITHLHTAVINIEVWCGHSTVTLGNVLLFSAHGHCTVASLNCCIQRRAYKESHGNMVRNMEVFNMKLWRFHSHSSCFEFWDPISSFCIFYHLTVIALLIMLKVFLSDLSFLWAFVLYAS